MQNYGGYIYSSKDYGGSWSMSSAPLAWWWSVASDVSGKYLAAVQEFSDISGTIPGYIYVSTGILVLLLSLLAFLLHQRKYCNYYER